MFHEMCAIARDFYAGRISFLETPNFIFWMVTKKTERSGDHASSWKIAT